MERGNATLSEKLLRVDGTYNFPVSHPWYTSEDKIELSPTECRKSVLMIKYKTWKSSQDERC